MGRWIGVDYGLRRIGLAIADPSASIATPAASVAASGSAHEDAEAIIRWAAVHDPGGFVVGLPLNMNGSAGPQARLTEEFAEALRERSGLPVELFDERLTSFHADQLMKTAAMRGSRRKRLRDALAAQIILQAYLDSQASGGPPCPPDAPTTS